MDTPSPKLSETGKRVFLPPKPQLTILKVGLRAERERFVRRLKSQAFLHMVNTV